MVRRPRCRDTLPVEMRKLKRCRWRDQWLMRGRQLPGYPNSVIYEGVYFTGPAPAAMTVLAFEGLSLWTRPLPSSADVCTSFMLLSPSWDTQNTPIAGLSGIYLNTLTLQVLKSIFPISLSNVSKINDIAGRRQTEKSAGICQLLLPFCTLCCFASTDDDMTFLIYSLICI